MTKQEFNLEALRLALAPLEDGLASPPKNSLERDGVIQRFEYTFDCEFLCFGSRTSGTSRPDSDLDIAVKCEKQISRGLLAQARDAFEEGSLSLKVDLVDYYAVSDDFRRIIDRKNFKLN